MPKSKIKGERKAVPNTVTSIPGLKPVFKTPSSNTAAIPAIELDAPTSSALESSQSALYSMAPIVPYGDDLEYWSKTNLSFQDVSLHSGLEYHHRFLGEIDGDKNLSQDTLSQLRKRSRYLEPAPIVDIQSCNAPMKNGKLCGRKDIKKCPIHGIIVSRDAFGVPVVVDNDLNQFAESSSAIATSVWQDLESQVNSAYNLEAPTKSRRSKLAQPVVEASTSKKRLAKKLKAGKGNSTAEKQNLIMRDRMAFRW